jgi:DNA-binding SARP family transcriptional activator
VFEPGLEQDGDSRFVLTTHEGYHLAPVLAVTVDLDQLQEHLRQGRIADAAENWDSARTAFAHVEQLYGGDFALAKPDPAEPEEYRRIFLEALCWLAADDLGRNALDSCITRSRRLLREDRWHPLAPALLIEAYLARGDRRAARRQYERYIQDHGAPSPQIAQIARTHGL